MSRADAGRQLALVRTIQLAVVALVIALWIGLTATHAVSPLLLPGPADVAAALQTLAATPGFWSNIGVTVSSTLEAFVLAAVAGLGVGFLVGRSPRFTEAFRPLLAGVFAIPITLFFPLIGVMFGLGPPSKIAFGALYGFFPVVLSTIAGFAGVDRLFLRSARSQGATPWQTLRHVYLPGAMPVVAGGLRIGFFITLASVLGAETLYASAGIGHAIANEAELLDTAPMYAWIVSVLILVALLNGALALVRTRGAHDR